MLNRSRRREIEERLKKGTMNPGHLNSLSVNDLASLCRALGIETPHKRTDMVNALLRLNGKSVKVPSAPTYNVSRDGLNEMILECLNDPTNPATAKMREEISETLVVAMLYVLRSKYGFAQKRIDDFLKEFNDVTDGITSGQLSLSEMHKEIAKPYKDGKCNLKIRYEDSKVKKWVIESVSGTIEDMKVFGCPSCPFKEIGNSGVDN